ncbi:glycoside hydrolase family 3 N-terminal domain-containing protein [Aggregatimonas sangjinii]|nr:glycoside hydrolase family 3 N-terminal domain-containing protein [Aggregatimonas sangjinii]
MKNTLLSLTLTLIFISAGFAQKEEMAYKDASLTIEERVADLLPRMSIDEKVAQMRIFHANIGIEANDKGKLQLSERVIEKLKIGIAGIKNPGEHLSPLAAAKLNNELQEYIIKNNRWGIPALFVTESYNGVDAEGCTRFGRPITSAASFNPELVNRIWDVVGREARLRGMHMCHSPEADIVRDPRFGRMSEAFGEDTYLTTQMVVNAIKGVQGNYEGLGKGTHIGAVAKHFAGYGQVLGGSNFAAVEISQRTLIDEIYPPFEAAIKDAKTLGIMASHGDLNGIASHGNPELLTGVLRDQWNFDGYVVSDSNDIARLYYFMKVAETPEAAALMGLVAGIDIDLYAEDSYAYLPEMVKKDPSIEKMIDRSVKRVLRTKMILGLFENPYVDIKKVKNGVRSEQALNLALEADLESIILLKNDGNTLPLQKESLKKIALLGPLVNEGTQKAFESVLNDGMSVTALQGFKLTDENNSVPKLVTTDAAVLDNMVQTAADADVAILFLGGDEFTAKEAYFNNALGDRATIEPLGAQDELVRKVKALGKPLIVVLQHRRTLSINTIAEKADAILDGWDLSEFGDTAVAKIVFGDVSPSGKLPVTVPRSIGQLPFHYSMKEINKKKGYLFLEDGPLYPFGHGLSYGDFEYSDVQLSKNSLTPTSEIQVNATVTNNGKMTAKEVVQLYIKDEIGSVTRPDKELKGFEKIELAPGESKSVTFRITPEMLEFTGLAMEKVLEAGDYTVTVGTSSAVGVTAKFRLEK